ncbi:hypothetical protein Tco_0245083 [Tanacetum coccineum]
MLKTQIPLLAVLKCFVCGSKLHLIKDCDFYNCEDSVPCKSKATSVPADSRNSSASVTTGGSDPAASRNRPAVNSAGRPNPTGRRYSFLLEDLEAVPADYVPAGHILISADRYRIC